MPNYRRAFVPGGCWFFTANLLDRRSNLLTDQIEALRDATRRVRGAPIPHRRIRRIARPHSRDLDFARRETRIFRCDGD